MEPVNLRRRSSRTLMMPFTRTLKSSPSPERDKALATGYDEWAEFLKGSLEKKADIEMIKLEKVPGGIEYSASLCYTL